MHSSFGKGDIDSKVVAMPIRMHMSITEVNPMGIDRKPNCSRKNVKIKGGKASNTNFGSSSEIVDIADLRGESDIFEGEKKTRGEASCQGQQRASARDT